MFCPKCGKENLNSSSFCTGCGAKLEKAAPSPAQNPTPSPAQSPSDGGSVFAPPVSFSGMPSYSPAPQRPLAAVKEKWPIITIIFAALYLFNGLVYDVALFFGSSITAGLIHVFMALPVYIFTLIAFILKTKKKPIITAIPLMIMAAFTFISTIINIIRGALTFYSITAILSSVSSIFALLGAISVAVLYTVHTVQKRRTMVIPVIMICLYSLSLIINLISTVVSIIEFSYYYNIITYVLIIFNLLVAISGDITYSAAAIILANDSKNNYQVRY